MATDVPVLIGIAHVEQRIDDPGEAREPVELMHDAVRRAIEDAGLDGVLPADSVRVVRGIWPYQDPARSIAEAIGAPDAQTALTAYGGNFVQSAVNASALDIASGNHQCIVLTGAECGSTQARAARRQIDLDWQALPGQPELQIGEDLDMRHEAEKRIRLGRPIQVYPLFETALRHHQGLSVDDHLVAISELWSRFSQVAAGNPNAWLREPKSAREIRTPSDSNRPVSFPYPKFMNSNNNVDQGAALILCSEAKARALGVPESNWIYPWTGTDAHDHYFVSNRDNLYTSPGIRIAGRRCLELADLTPADLDHVDVYSCFPSAVQIAARELGLPLDRPLTVTGGLTFAGGPLNNYVMHAIVRMAQLLRADRGARGLVTANGGYLTKHAFGVYSAQPPSRPFAHANVQAEVDAQPRREVAIDHRGAGVVEAYSVMYGAQGLDKAFVACRLGDGRRAWGVTRDADTLRHMTEEEFCGREVTLKDHEARF
jgi:acetyl-CoA C-acetyltransferase